MVVDTLRYCIEPTTYDRVFAVFIVFIALLYIYCADRRIIRKMLKSNKKG